MSEGDRILQSNELELLVLLSRPDFSPALHARAKLLGEAIDASKLAKLLRFHRLSLHVMHALKTAGARLFDDSVYQTCLSVAAKEQARTARQLSFLKIVNTALQREGIPTMVLKGSATSARLFGAPDRRVCSDVDVMIQAANTQKAIQVLKEIGFRALKPLLRGEVDPRKLRRIQDWSNNIEFEYVNNGRIIFELHWRLGRYFHEFPFFEKTIWQNAKYLEFDGCRYLTLSPEHEVLFLCNHGCKHEWKRLHWLADIAAILCDSSTNWVRLHEMAKAAGLETQVAVSCVLAHRIFEAPLPEIYQAHSPRIDRIAASIIRRRYHDNPRNDSSLEDAAMELRGTWLLKGFKPKLVVLLSHFRPGPNDWAVIDLPSWAEPAYVPVRIGRILYEVCRSAVAKQH